MIGYSLSICCKDIAKKKVKLSSVEKIIAGTKIPNDEIFEEVIKRYNESIWKNTPIAEGIARKLWIENKIEQPRLNGEVHTFKTPWKKEN